MWNQVEILLSSKPRGFHLITDEVLSKIPCLAKMKVGLLHLFIMHTSASLSINENADPDVRYDMETAFNRIVPESLPFVHTLEGPDDMPAHVKASMLGSSLTLPISCGALKLGTWQGIYLCEHRDAGGRRQLLATIWGEPG